MYCSLQVRLEVSSPDSQSSFSLSRLISSASATRLSPARTGGKDLRLLLGEPAGDAGSDCCATGREAWVGGCLVSRGGTQELRGEAETILNALDEAANEGGSTGIRRFGWGRHVDDTLVVAFDFVVLRFDKVGMWKTCLSRLWSIYIQFSYRPQVHLCVGAKK